MIKHDRMLQVVQEYFNTIVDVCIDGYTKYGKDKFIVVLKKFMTAYRISEITDAENQVPIQNLTIGEFIQCGYQADDLEPISFANVFFGYIASAVAYDITVIMQELLQSLFATDIDFKEVDKLIKETDITYFSNKYTEYFSNIQTLMTNYELIDRNVSDFFVVDTEENN